MTDSRGLSGLRALRRDWWLSLGSLAGLAIGIVAGSFAASMPTESGGPLLRGADALVLAWTNAFRLIVPPLVVSQLYVAIADQGVNKRGAIHLGIAVPGVFAGLLFFTAFVTVVATTALMTLPWFAGLSLVEAGPLPPPVPGSGSPSGGNAWVNDLIPPNLVAAAGADKILPLMLFTLAFTLAARRLAPDLQATLQRGFEAIRGATFVLVAWIMRPTPLVLLALGFRSAFDSGFKIGGVFVAYAALSLVLLAIATLALYPVASLIGRVPLGALGRAAIGPQIVAATTRSSLATIPALLAAAEQGLRIPPAIGSVVIPIGGAALKLSRAVSSPAKLLFLGHVLGIPLGVEQIVTFAVTIILLSPSTQGIPNVISQNRGLPAYITAGVPAPYVILLGATNSITDVLMTVLNTTGYLIATVLVRRFTPGGGLASEPTDPPMASTEGA